MEPPSNSRQTNTNSRLPPATTLNVPTRSLASRPFAQKSFAATGRYIPASERYQHTARPPTSSNKTTTSKRTKKSKAAAEYKRYKGYVRHANEPFPLAAGWSHCIIVVQGELITWGNNLQKQVGYPTLNPDEIQADPDPVEAPEKVVLVEAGGWHSLALLRSGQILTWGRNTHGQLGLGRSYIRQNLYCQQWQKVRVQGDIVALSAGDAHSLALTADGDVYAWGRNTWCQVGFRKSMLWGRTQAKPRLIRTLYNIVEIAAGGIHSMAVNNVGQVFVWGSNCYGQFGDGSKIMMSDKAVKPHLSGVVLKIAAGGGHCVALMDDGSVWTWGRNDCGQLGTQAPGYHVSVPQRVPLLSGALNVYAGHLHTMAMLDTGEIMAWGSNHFGQLGHHGVLVQPSPGRVPVKGAINGLACGAYHCFAVMENYEVWAWGCNMQSQLGITWWDKTDPDLLVMKHRRDYRREIRQEVQTETVIENMYGVADGMSDISTPSMRRVMAVSQMIHMLVQRRGDGGPANYGLQSSYGGGPGVAEPKNLTESLFVSFGLPDAAWLDDELAMDTDVDFDDMGLKVDKQQVDLMYAQLKKLASRPPPKNDFWDEQKDRWDLEEMRTQVEISKMKAQDSPDETWTVLSRLAPDAVKDDYMKGGKWNDDRLRMDFRLALGGQPEPMFAQLKWVEPAAKKSLYFDRFKEQWKSDALRQDLENAQTKNPSRVFNLLSEMVPDTQSQSKYFNKFTEVWDMHSLRKDVQHAMGVQELNPFPLLKRSPDNMFERLQKIDANLDKRDFLDPVTKQWRTQHLADMLDTKVRGKAIMSSFKPLMLSANKAGGLPLYSGAGADRMGARPPPARSGGIARVTTDTETIGRRSSAGSSFKERRLAASDLDSEYDSDYSDQTVKSKAEMSVKKAFSKLSKRDQKIMMKRAKSHDSIKKHVAKAGEFVEDMPEENIPLGPSMRLQIGKLRPSTHGSPPPLGSLREDTSSAKRRGRGAQQSSSGPGNPDMLMAQLQWMTEPRREEYLDQGQQWKTGELREDLRTAQRKKPQKTFDLLQDLDPSARQSVYQNAATKSWQYDRLAMDLQKAVGNQPQSMFEQLCKLQPCSTTENYWNTKAEKWDRDALSRDLRQEEENNPQALFDLLNGIQPGQQSKQYKQDSVWDLAQLREDVTLAMGGRGEALFGQLEKIAEVDRDDYWNKDLNGWDMDLLKEDLADSRLQNADRMFELLQQLMPDADMMDYKEANKWNHEKLANDLDRLQDKLPLGSTGSGMGSAAPGSETGSRVPGLVGSAFMDSDSGEDDQPKPPRQNMPEPPSPGDDKFEVWSSLPRVFYNGCKTTPTTKAIMPVDAGWAHSCGLPRGGGLLHWGSNLYEQAGVFKADMRVKQVPRTIQLPGEVKQIALGGWHTVVLIKGKGVWTWGENAFGQLGFQTKGQICHLACKVNVNAEVMAIGAGAYHSLTVTTGGQVWAWGRDNCCQLGQGKELKHSTPRALDVDRRKGPQKVLNVSDAVMVAGGNFHSMALTKSGEVFTWGRNADGQLGTGGLKPRITGKAAQADFEGCRIVDIAAGGNHCIALSEEGEIWTWGRNEHGQLGLPGLRETENPVPEPVPMSRKAVGIAAGEAHTLALTDDGQAWVWGSNHQCQLDIGNRRHNTIFELTPAKARIKESCLGIASGAHHALFLLKSGKVITSGLNHQGQLGITTYKPRHANWPPRDHHLVCRIKKATDVDVDAYDDHVFYVICKVRHHTMVAFVSIWSEAEETEIGWEFTGSIDCQSSDCLQFQLWCQSKSGGGADKMLGLAEMEITEEKIVGEKSLRLDVYEATRAISSELHLFFEDYCLWDHQLSLTIIRAKHMVTLLDSVACYCTVAIKGFDENLFQTSTCEGLRHRLEKVQDDPEDLLMLLNGFQREPPREDYFDQDMRRWDVDRLREDLQAAMGYQVLRKDYKRPADLGGSEMWEILRACQKDALRGDYELDGRWDMELLGVDLRSALGAKPDTLFAQLTRLDPDVILDDYFDHSKMKWDEEDLERDLQEAQFNNPDRMFEYLVYLTSEARREYYFNVTTNEWDIKTLKEHVRRAADNDHDVVWNNSGRVACKEGEFLEFTVYGRDETTADPFFMGRCTIEITEEVIGPVVDIPILEGRREDAILQIKFREERGQDLDFDDLYNDEAEPPIEDVEPDVPLASKAQLKKVGSMFSSRAGTLDNSDSDSPEVRERKSTMSPALSARSPTSARSPMVGSYGARETTVIDVIGSAEDSYEPPVRMQEVREKTIVQTEETTFEAFPIDSSAVPLKRSQSVASRGKRGPPAGSVSRSKQSLTRSMSTGSRVSKASREASATNLFSKRQMSDDDSLSYADYDDAPDDF